jgi:arylsulfatase A-like enzyme
VATRLVPLLERNARGFRRLVHISLPVALGLVVILGASPWVADRIKQSRAEAQPLPPPGSPNVLLIVMDTVAAGHLSLHGYDRPTSTTLVELAEQGIRFDSAQAAASWTLPSHATMFTGRWMHELSVGWLTPLNSTDPTLAEFLGAKGYATAGFVANTSYCARDSGLDRGFTQYQDFIFPELTVFRKTVLVSRALLAIQSTVSFLEDQLELARLRLYVQYLWRWFDIDRKPAAVVNRELLDWLSQRGQPERPFFAFLNYFDAHYPYQLPAGRYHRFGGTPADTRQRAMIEHWGDLDKRPLSPQELEFAASAYDDCIADLDEQIGILLDKLRRNGVLERTWLIIAADHGESFGEHTGVFCHGTSVYQTEVHVPFLIIPPGGSATKRVVKEAVSWRDLAATIVDVTGQAAGSPFPGKSLARFRDGTAPAESLQPASADPPLAEVVPNPNTPGNRDTSGLPKPTWR